jgi:hypothetical protein
VIVLKGVFHFRDICFNAVVSCVRELISLQFVAFLLAQFSVWFVVERAASKRRLEVVGLGNYGDRVRNSTDGVEIKEGRGVDSFT